MARRNDHNRNEISDLALVAAEKIILEQGPEGLSTRKIATKIGYTVGTLYLLFENLDELIIQINARTLDRLHLLITDLARQQLAHQDRLTQLAQIYIHFAYGDPHRWTLIFEHHLPNRQPMPGWYVEKTMRVFAVVEASLKPLAPHRNEREISQAACALWAGIHGICILGITNKLGHVGEDIVQDLAKSLMVSYLYSYTNHQAWPITVGAI